MSVFMTNPGQPVYVRVAERIKKMIAQDYEPGDTLPTYRALMDQFGVAMRTVKRAVDLLAAQGVVSPIRGRGTVVLRRLERDEVTLSRIALVARMVINRLFHDRYLAEIAGALCRRVDELGAELRIFSLERPTGSSSPQEVMRTGVDAAILLGVTDDTYIAEFARHWTPLVAVDHHAAAVPLDYVVCDNFGAVDTVVEHLARLGHRRIAYVEYWAPERLARAHGYPGAWEESDAVERREGFVAAMEARGLVVHRPFYTPTTPADKPHEPNLEDLGRALLAAQDAPTAVVTDGDASAVDVIGHLDRLGLSVPADVSVAAIAGPDLTAADMPPLTYCRMNFTEMGTRAVDLLERRSRTARPAEPNVVRIGFRFVPGRTIGPPLARP